MPFALPNLPPLSSPPSCGAVGSEHHGAGHQDPGEGHEGGHGHLPAHRHHCQAVRRGAAAELRGHDQDVSGEKRLLLLQAQPSALGRRVPEGGRRDNASPLLGETLGHPHPRSLRSLVLRLSREDQAEGHGEEVESSRCCFGHRESPQPLADLLRWARGPRSGRGAAAGGRRVARVSVSNSISLLPLPLSVIFSLSLFSVSVSFSPSGCCCLSVSLSLSLQKQLVSSIRLGKCTNFKLSISKVGL